VEETRGGLAGARGDWGDPVGEERGDGPIAGSGLARAIAGGMEGPTLAQCSKIRWTKIRSKSPGANGRIVKIRNTLVLLINRSVFLKIGVVIFGYFFLLKIGKWNEKQ
jgi:hypothetical protein